MSLYSSNNSSTTSITSSPKATSTTINPSSSTNIDTTSIYNREETEVEMLNPSFFKYNRELELLICSSCSIALLKTNSIKEHLTPKHLDFKKSLKNKEFKEIISNLEKNYPMTTYTTPLEPYKYFFKDLSITTAYSNTKDDKLFTSRKMLRNYINSEYGIKNIDKSKVSYINTTKVEVQALYTRPQVIFKPKPASTSASTNLTSTKNTLENLELSKIGRAHV